MSNTDEPIPLYSLEAEMGVLGSMLLSQRAAEEVAGTLDANDFYRHAHSLLYKAIKYLVDEGRSVDYLTVKEELTARGILTEIGGEDYLLEVAEFTPTAANARHYAMIVQDRATMRRLERAGKDIIDLAHDPDESAARAKVDKAEQILFEVGRGQIGREFKHARELAKEFFYDVDTLMETGEPSLGLQTNFYDLDALTTGFYPGDLVIVAARPSMGKTSLVLDIANRVAKQKKGAVAIFSLEMTGAQLVKRLASMISGVSAYELKRQKLAEKSYHALADACESLYNTPIFIDDNSEVSGLEIKGKCRRLAVENGLSLIIVDYLQLMRANRKVENRVQEISDIARALKGIAKDLQVPVIALSQLNRGVEMRIDKRPQLSDLRESGSIEQEADMVMMIYRDQYYADRSNPNALPKEEDRTEVAEISVQKHRNGEVGTVLLGFQPSYARFRDLAKQSQDDYWASQKERAAQMEAAARKGKALVMQD
ncbi:MAG: replicative DNA helicase [Armatimonadetes bacterium]|nr:replicative DNA helicase [Armatimonadota bacterium]